MSMSGRIPGAGLALSHHCLLGPAQSRGRGWDRLLSQGLGRLCTLGDEEMGPGQVVSALPQLAAGGRGWRDGVRVEGQGEGNIPFHGPRRAWQTQDLETLRPDLTSWCP